jgi:hypothetical protein
MCEAFFNYLFALLRSDFLRFSLRYMAFVGNANVYANIIALG